MSKKLAKNEGYNCVREIKRSLNNNQKQAGMPSDFLDKNCLNLRFFESNFEIRNDITKYLKKRLWAGF